MRAAQTSHRGALPVRIGSLAALAATILLACVASVAVALPEGRVYEMVSPVFKGGYGTRGAPVAVAPDGESAAFFSLGVFAGATGNAPFSGYLARRGPSGWSTTSLLPPATIAPYLADGAPLDFSSTLESSLDLTIPGPNTGNALVAGTEVEMLVHRNDTPETAPNFEVVGDPLQTQEKGPFIPRYLGASADLSHVVLATGRSEALLPAAAIGERYELYDLTAGGSGAPSLRLVGLNDQGELIDPNCPVKLGGEDFNGREFNAIAADGAEIFFTTSKNRVYGTICDTGGEPVPVNPAIVYARIDGQKTLQLSAPLASDCRSGPCLSAPQARAEFQGANEAGTRVFFTTAQPLVSADTDGQTDLYMAEIGCPGAVAVCEPADRELTSLTQVSHDPHAGDPAEVQGVVSIAPDGSHVYFVAAGVLGGANAEGAAPVQGADNLYVYDATAGASPVFVTDLCSGPEASGTVEDGRCPADLEAGEHLRNDDALWLDAHSEAQTAGEGRFLLFSSYGQLVAGDTDTAKDVYRYDAETGLLERVSIGEAGADANGNDGNFDAQLPVPAQNLSSARGDTVYENYEMNSRAISADGTRVLFATAAPLSPSATNGLENMYEWHEKPGLSAGSVSLISSGAAVEPENEAVISPSGRDIFFQTVQGLVMQDSDGARDIYDARLGGGFPPPPVSRQPCSGDACQGPLTNPAPLLVPGSVSQTPGESAAVQKPAARVRKVKTKKKVKRRKRKRKASGRARKSTGGGRR
jgi:hypothetical protein